jgi:hypothetical protein
VPAVPYKELRLGEVATSSEEMRGRAQKAAEIQRARGYRNARMPTRSVRKDCALDDTGERTLEMAMRRLSLSARAHDRILNVARTVADLDQSDSVAAKHIAEATAPAAVRGQRYELPHQDPITGFGFHGFSGPRIGGLGSRCTGPGNEQSSGAGYAITQTSGGAAEGAAVGTATLFSSTDWTTGFRVTYLGISASPANPIGAFLPSTVALDAIATGFSVYQVNVGTLTFRVRPTRTRLLSGISVHSRRRLTSLDF